MAKISIFTASTPWIDFATLVPKVKAAGFDGIEVELADRTYDPNQPPHPHTNNAACLDWEHHIDEALAAKALLDQHDLECSAIGSQVSIDDIDSIAKAVEVAKILGCEFIRVSAPRYDANSGYRSQLAEARACYRDLDQISAETGIDSLIEMHHLSICPSASSAMRVLEGLDPTHVGVIFDPANTIDHGFEDIAMAVDLLGPFLRHVHCKNIKRAAGNDDRLTGATWHGEFCAPADGAIDWPAVISILNESGYDGWYVSENFANRDQGIEALNADREWITSVLK